MLRHDQRWIVRCCYLGMFIQALVINLTPLLFIPLKEQLGLTYEQVGRLVLLNFLTQMTVDLICCWLADRMNPKPLIVAANLLAAVGLWLFAFAPAWFAQPYDGLILGTVVFSIGCGLLEVLLSPIFNAVPSDRKAADMAFLHAFYPIGKVTVIAFTAVALYLIGAQHWRWIMLAWSVFPVVNTLGFALVQLPPFAPEHERQTLRSLVRQPVFLGLLAAIALAGATEVTLAQWTSAFAEKGLGCSKLLADLLGFGLFGLGMIGGRLWFGHHGEAGHLRPWMLGGAALSVLAYLVISLSPGAAWSLAACAPAGVFVSLLWPGVISLSAAHFPRAGGSMFALLAAAGDTGAALMPWLVGLVADRAIHSAPQWTVNLNLALTPDQFALRVGLLLGTLGPLLLTILLARNWLAPRGDQEGRSDTTAA